ncbi:hypothetical protein SAMN05421676_101458 [Salinibacillus kushneri]|uniref:Uncharacterized protein n=1 Tax=Salinibacillus kushneri TaxID=237682 RepID=A0A1H9ZD14_9BACI|nr:hypothetical protein [Salinibacillus kushneri]SES78957.1 hypothetical protein SAMN05421676_101458 [Salinibacillus kushneri]
MTTEFNVLPHSIRSKEALQKITSLDRKNNYTIDQKVFYPYQFVSYHIKVKTFLVKEGYLGCTIDMISGRESVIDSKPTFFKKTLCKKERIQPVLTREKAEKQAIQYFQRQTAKRLKFLALPRYSLTDSHLFYRPYWIISSKNHRFIVDGLSGRFHPLT